MIFVVLIGLGNHARRLLVDGELLPGLNTLREDLYVISFFWLSRSRDLTKNNIGTRIG